MKCKIPPRPLSEKEQERINQRNIKSNDRVFNYVGRLITLSLREKAGFGHTRFRRFNDGGTELGQWYIDRYSVEGEAAQDYAVTSYYALRSELLYIGWDPEVELWRDDVFETLAPPADGMTRSRRDMRADMIEYAKKISFYVREMISMDALELHDTNRFGYSRLNVVLHPVRDRYLGLMRLYLRLDREGYNAELKKALDEFNALGIFKEEKL
jgi:hypothetical protein